MAEQLEEMTALGGTAPRVDRIGAITITERPDIALASLAGRRGASLEGALPLALPGPGGFAEGPDGMGALWLGPDAWMIEAPRARMRELDRHLAGLTAGRASVTDQTDAWVRFDIEAPDTGALFERLCMLDTRAMTPQNGGRSLIEHVGCLIICRQAGRRFSVLGQRSAAASLHHALVAAARALTVLETPR